MQLHESQNVRLLTIRQASEFLSIPVSTLYGWVWQRRIPFVKIERVVRFDIGDLEQFIQTNRRSVLSQRSLHNVTLGRKLERITEDDYSLVYFCSCD